MCAPLHCGTASDRCHRPNSRVPLGAYNVALVHLLGERLQQFVLSTELRASCDHSTISLSTLRPPSETATFHVAMIMQQDFAYTTRLAPILPHTGCAVLDVFLLSRFTYTFCARFRAYRPRCKRRLERLHAPRARTHTLWRAGGQRRVELMERVCRRDPEKGNCGRRPSAVRARS